MAMISKENVLTLVLKKGNYRQLTLVLIMFLSTVGMFAQQEFLPRQNISTRGDVLVTGNAILGLITNPTNPALGPNGAYNGGASNGGVGLETAYIDIDQDNSTFSSSSADLIDPSAQGCAEIIYAGLYWTSNYYLAREDNVDTSGFGSDDIDTSDAEDSNVILNLNNSIWAGDFALRPTELSNDNSNVKLSPASSNLVVVTNGCNITNVADVAGNIAVMNRSDGSCTDREKIVNAQNAGAVGVIIINDNGSGQHHLVTGSGTTVTIPSATLGDNDIFGNSLIDVINFETNVMNATISTTGNEQETGLPTNDVRINGTADYRNIKFGFGAPGSITYVDVQPDTAPQIIDVNGTPTSTHGGIIYDGYADTASNTTVPGQASDNVPYTCYADVTSIVQARGYGTYTVADMKATVGVTSGVSGAAGGWSLVVIYNDPSPAAENRFMTIFDGFREIQGTNTNGVDIEIAGFQTLPPNLPVNVKFGLASLEGDLGISGDRLGILEPAELGNTPYDNNDFTTLSNGANGATNFFNSSISIEDAITTTRLPNSTNTLGFDLDFWTLGNAAKDLLANNQSETVFRLRTTQDTYQAFMTLFSVEEIVPELRLLKEVYDPGDLTTVINNQSVELGDQLVYRLRIENIGNEDYRDNVIITDILPANVDLLSIDGIDIQANPSGNLVTIPTITYSVTTAPGGEQTIGFEIPPNLLTHSTDTTPGTGELQIDFTVQLVSDCASLRDACSNEINNIANASYVGVLSNEPGFNISSSELIAPCDNTDGLATNFLANVPACNNDVSFCGGTLQLVAGAGYDQYTWSGPNGFSAVTNVNFVDVPSGTSGVYTVVKDDLTPDSSGALCMTLTEEFDVTDFTTIAHPLQDDAAAEDFITYFDSTSGGCNVPLAKISLCGDDSYTVESGFITGNLISITWEELTNNTCFDRDDNCPAVTGGCDAAANWTDISPAPLTTSLEFDTAGEYRMIVEFDGGCSQVFYFDINKNDYQPEVDIVDMECLNDGSVQVNNIPVTTLRFLIRDQSLPAPTLPGDIGLFTNDDGSFVIPFNVNPFNFTVYAVDTAFPNCVYRRDGTVRSFNPVFGPPVITAPECTNNDNLNGLGSISIDVTGGIPQYEYRIIGGPNNIDIVTGNEAISNGDYTFNDLEPGTYTLQVVSNRNPDPECFAEFTGLVVPEAPTFTARVDLIAPATCTEGAIVEVVVTAGSGGPYEFADSTGVFNSPLAGDPQDRFRFTLPTTAVPSDVFTFRVNDASTALACIISADITGIEAYVPIEIQRVTPTDPLCPLDNGRIRVELTAASAVAGRTFTYELLDNTNTPIPSQTDTNSLIDFTFANVPVGTGYTVRVTHNNTTDPAGSPICPVEDGTYDIEAPDAVEFDIDRTRDLSCITGSEDAQVTIDNFRGGSTTNYEYSLNPTGTFTAITGSSVVIDVSAAQTGFTVYVREVGVTGCAVSNSVDIPALVEVTDLTFSTPGASNCTTQTFNVTVQAEPVGPTYTYAVTPAPISGNANTGVFRLRRGTIYTFTATNTTNQCFRSEAFDEDTIPQIRIIDATGNPESCEGEDDGTISFTIENSTNFEYEVRGPAPSNALVTDGTSTTATVTIQSPAVSLEPGTYTIEVTDTSLTPASANCSDDITVVIGEKTPVTFTINDVVQDCGNNLNEVSISNPGGGNGPGYTYTLTHPTNGTFGPVASNVVISNVPNGGAVPYVVEVFDTDGCSETQDLLIEALTPLGATLTAASDVCLDDSAISFEIDIDATNTGEPPYTYTVSRDGTQVQGATTVAGPVPVPNFTTNTFTQDGVYEIVITDSEGCTITLTETVEPAVSIVARRVNDLRCDPVTSALLQAEIELTISNGYTDYTVTWENTTNTTSGTVTGSPGAGPVFTHLTSDVGDFIFTVTDDRGCTDTSTAEVTSNNNPPTVTAPDITVDCNGDDGIIRITATGADPGGYEINFAGTGFQPMPPSGTIEFVRGQGNYTFEFRDSRNCPYTGFDVDVLEPAVITAGSVKTDITCDDTNTTGSGETLGTITLTMSGGTIDPPGTLGDASEYTYQVSLNGTVDATIIPQFNATVPALGLDQVLFDGLDFGFYEILITDDKGCTTTVTETVAAGPRVTFNTTAVGATCPLGYSLIVNITGGSTTAPGFNLDLRIEGAAAPIVNIDLGDVAGVPVTTYTEPGLDFQVTYVVTVTDRNTGCRFRDSFTQPGPSSPMITAVVPGDITCNETPALSDGTFTFTVAGYDPVAGQTLDWEVLDQFDQTNVIATGTTPVLATDPETFGPLGALPDGRYTLRVTENLGAACPSNLFDFEIDTPDPLVTTGNNPDMPDCETTTTVAVTTTGGTLTGGTVTPGDGYTYQIVERGDPENAAAWTTLPIPVTGNPNTVLIDTDTDSDGITDQLLWDILTRDDNANCVHRLPIDVNVIPGPTLTTPTIVDNPCDIDDFVFTVTATATAFGPGGTLSYGIDDGVNPVNFVTDGLSHEFMVDAPGTYTVIVRDANGCTDTDLITILPPLEIEAIFTTPPTCTDPNGTITTSIVAPGTLAGATPPRYELFDISGAVPVSITFNDSGVFPGVTAGEYEIVLTDFDRNPPTGCTFSTQVSLDAPTPPVINGLVGATDMTCNGDSPGTGSIEITLDATGPIDPDATYQYEITTNAATLGTNPRQDSPIFNGLTPNTYFVRVWATIVNGSGPSAITIECFDDEDFIIGEPAPVIGTASVVQYACDPSTRDEVFPVITIEVSGGTGPYTISYTRPAPLTPVVDEVVVDADLGTPGIQHEVVATVAGNYNFTIEDSNNCTGTTIPDPVVVNPFQIMTMAEVTQATSATCVSPEIVTVTVTGGSGTYIFQRVDNTGTPIETQGPIASTTANFTLTGGAANDGFSFVVIDDVTNCSIPATYTIPEFDFLEIRAEEASRETCFGQEDGRVRLFVLGYSGTFNYTIVDASNTTVYDSAIAGFPETTPDTDITTEDEFVLPQASEPGLGIGNYTINITEVDAPQCTDMTNFNIMGPTNDFEVILDPRRLQETCDPGSDGAVQASVTGAQGTVSYTIALSTSPTVIIETNTDGAFDGLTAGTYIVTATDDNVTFTCPDDDTVTILPPPDDVTVAPIPNSSVSCFEAQDGTITVVGGGSNPPFRYSLSLSGTTVRGPQTSDTFDLLAPGTYTVTVTDALGCTNTTNTTIAEPSELTVNFTATLIECVTPPVVPSVDVTVTGTSDVAITDFVVLDIGTDRLNPTEFDRNATGLFTLPEGEYQFYIIDADGCQSDPSGALPVIPIPDIQITLDDRFAFVNCNGGSNGVIDASVTGGTGAYTYTLTTVTGTLTDGTPFTPIVQSNSVFRDLAPAEYIYTVTTDRSCSAEARFPILDPPEFTPVFTFEDVSCNGLDDGFIRIDASGGTPPYSFAINNEAFLNDVSDGEIGLHIFDELAPGTYEVIAQDALGCSEIMTFTIDQPDQIMVSLDGVVTNETCFGDADGEISIIITGGTPPYRTNITNNDADFVEGVFTYSDLPAGQTTIFIIDANDCRTDFTETIEPGVILNAELSDRLECPVIDLDGNVTQPPRYFVDFILGDDSVTTDIVYTLTGVNGTPNPPNNFNMTGIFEVAPGEYEGSMLHALGCPEVVGRIVVEEYTPMTIPVAVMTNNPQDPNEYEINVTGGERLDVSPFYTFEVGYIGLTGNEVPLNEVVYGIIVDGNVFRIRQTGFYALRVTDANGCQVIGIQELTYINIRIPNYFTPGTDNPSTPDDESYWYPRQILPPGTVDDPFFFENMEVMVFDRYGRMLATFIGDQDGKGWNGLYQGSELPSGDYWFTIVLNDVDNREFTGHFTLYR